MIDAVTIKMTFVLTRSCVISGRRFTVMTCVHEIMRGQDGIIRISQNQNRTSAIILQREENKKMLKIGITFLVGMWPGLPKLYLVSHRLNVMLVSIVSLLYNCRSIFPRANFSPKTWNWPNQIVVMSSNKNVLLIQGMYKTYCNDWWRLLCILAKTDEVC